MHLKSQLRIIGIDDAPHVKGKTKKVLVVGAVFRGGEYMDNLLSTFVKVDGSDATANLAKMINGSRVRGDLRLIMLDGIAMAGFNVVDIQQLSKKTKLPVIVAIRDKPDFASIKKALRHFSDGKARWRLIEKAGRSQELEISNRELAKPVKIYFQFAGISKSNAEKVIKLTAKHGATPEPLRQAHIICQGIAMGESRGRA